VNGRGVAAAAGVVAAAGVIAAFIAGVYVLGGYTMAALCGLAFVILTAVVVFALRRLQPRPVVWRAPPASPVRPSPAGAFEREPYDNGCLLVEEEADTS